MTRQLLILTLGLILLAGGYFIYQNRNKPVPVDQPRKEIISNIKIGKYETLYKGGWEELNYIDTANAKNPKELYEVFSKTYPDLTDKNSEFFIQEIIIKDDIAEVYFGGDEGAITDRMGTTGPYNYSGLVTFALTEDEKIKKVDFKLKTEGNHFGPRISTRDDFIFLWPTQLLEKIANNSKQARVALASRKGLSDETSNWKTYTNTKYDFTLKYPSDWTVKEGINTADPKVYSIYFIHPNNGPGFYINISLYELVPEYKENASIDRIKAYRISEPSSMQFAYEELQFKKNLNTYQISSLYNDGKFPNTPQTQYDKEAVTIFNNMLSTFRFD